jgi:iron complex outermembrane recepter protein
MGRNMRNFTITKSISSIIAIVMLLGVTNTSYAQDGALELEEIIVTARKRDETLADAPYTITALTAFEIATKGINEIQDVASYSPGFFYSNNNVGKNSRTHRRLIFRGVNPRTDIPTRAAASMFIDGAPSIGSEFGSIDGIERIEVLKGPQGAHFGRSTYAGAINVVTKDPGDEFTGRVNLEAGQHGTQRTAVIMDGPLGDKFGYRLNVSSYDSDGMYDNANVPGQKLGAQSTDDMALTVVFEPSDRVKVKLRYHTWDDSDGPDAATAYDRESGRHNCSPGGTGEFWDPAQQGPWQFGAQELAVTTVCGKVPVPTASQIGQDTGSVRSLSLLDKRSNGSFYPLINGFRDVPDLIAPNHFGMEREAEELSAVIDINFDNGMNLNIIASEHENSYASHNDVDRRVTEGRDLDAGQGGGLFGSWGANHPADAFDMRMNSMADSGIEFRLSSSSDQRVRWMFGYSETDIDWLQQVIGNLAVYYPANGIDNANQDAIGANKVCYNPYYVFSGASVSASNACGPYGDISSNVNDVKWDDITTTAFYASIEADIGDKLTLSLDLRRQEDDVISGGMGAWDTSTTPRGVGVANNIVGDTFKSTLPRIILDYKPNDDTTIYASYSEGRLPGLFNASLLSLSATELASLKKETGGSGVRIDEEEAENIEIGLKKTILGGRGFISVAYYSTDLTNVHTPLFAVSYLGDDGIQQVISGNTTTQAGNAELDGIEIDGRVVVNENLALGFTYAINNSEIGSGFQSADTFDLIGDRNIVAGNEFSRYPVNSGSLSADYIKELSATRDLFARLDFIYTGKMYASNAMLSHTGSGSKVNVRIGVENDNYRIEAYATNLFDDNQPKGLQHLYDLSGLSGGFGNGSTTATGPRALAISLADKRTIGFRASYKF